MAARHFQYLSPRFGPANKPLPPSSWEVSVYYWWWLYLRRHDGYRKCCERDGTGAYSTLYRDFGDVHAVDFKQWWGAKIGREDRGAVLFAEPPAPQLLGELTEKDAWEAGWTHDSVMVVVVPLDQPKRHLQRRFATLLKARHKGQRGHQHNKISAALYPAHGHFSVHALKQMLSVYDLRIAEPELKLAEIGQRLRLVMSAMPRKGDRPKDAAAKRNVLNATVGRYLKRATTMIENTGKGMFPKA